eukprot:734838-Karenia_brevis.AAC.1
MHINISTALPAPGRCQVWELTHGSKIDFRTFHMTPSKMLRRCRNMLTRASKASGDAFPRKFMKI